MVVLVDVVVVVVGEAVVLSVASVLLSVTGVVVLLVVVVAAVEPGTDVVEDPVLVGTVVVVIFNLRQAWTFNLMMKSSSWSVGSIGLILSTVNSIGVSKTIGCLPSNVGSPFFGFTSSHSSSVGLPLVGVGLFL